LLPRRQARRQEAHEQGKHQEQEKTTTVSSLKNSMAATSSLILGKVGDVANKPTDAGRKRILSASASNPLPIAARSLRRMPLPSSLLLADSIKYNSASRQQQQVSPLSSEHDLMMTTPSSYNATLDDRLGEVNDGDPPASSIRYYPPFSFNILVWLCRWTTISCVVFVVAKRVVRYWLACKTCWEESDLALDIVYTKTATASNDGSSGKRSYYLPYPPDKPERSVLVDGSFYESFFAPAAASTFDDDVEDDYFNKKAGIPQNDCNNNVKYRYVYNSSFDEHTHSWDTVEEDDNNVVWAADHIDKFDV